jgi:hypothetical protein
MKSLSNNTPDVEGAAVIDNDGLMIASALSADLDEDSVGAMGAALLGLGERIASELERGDFELVMIRGSNGFVILTRCGPDAVLACIAGTKAKLGLIFLDLKRSAKELAALLG